MKPFALILEPPHIKLKIQGKTLEQVFSNALTGINSILHSDKTPSSYYHQHKLNLIADNNVALLVNFLNETMHQSHAEKALYHKIDFLTLTPTNAKIILYGHKITAFDEHINKIHPQADIEKKNGYYEASITLDL